MVASNELSFIISLTLSIVLTAVMQIFRSALASSQIATIGTGYLGSVIFMLILTAISNLQMTLFGKQYQSKLTEVIISLLMACFISGLVHRVSITTCFIFSMIALYYMNRLSARVHQTSTVTASVANNTASKKRK